MSAPSSSGFKRELSLTDLTFIGLGAIFGSGWLFAASHVSGIAGPAGIISWMLGGVAVLLLGFVYCELGAALPHAGGLVRFPVYSHGEMMGYLAGFITLIANSSLVSIEVVASRQYAGAWFPSLTQQGSSNPTIWGWLFQFVLLLFFFWLNYRGIKSFARVNNVISIFKFVVPLAVIITLFCFFKPENFSAGEFSPFGISGIEAAISAGGVIFAYLGLTPIVSVASEVKRPQRTIPIALILSVLLSTIIYVILQSAFIGAIPTEYVLEGWKSVEGHFTLPFRDIALSLGLGWLAVLVICDAIVSPSGTGNIYMSATPRIVYAWSRSGSFFKIFGTVDKKSGVPRAGLWLTFALSIFWTLPFPSWEALINVVSAALIICYALAPVTVAALRKTAPDLARPFRVRYLSILGPVSFAIAALIVFWSGWATVSWLLGLQLVLYVAYLCCARWAPTRHGSISEQIRSSSWLIGFYILMIIASYTGSFGGRELVGDPWDSIIVVIFSIGIYYWGANTGLVNFLIAEEEQVVEDGV